VFGWHKLDEHGTRRGLGILAFIKRSEVSQSQKRPCLSLLFTLLKPLRHVVATFARFCLGVTVCFSAFVAICSTSLLCAMDRYSVGMCYRDTEDYSINAVSLAYPYTQERSNTTHELNPLLDSHKAYRAYRRSCPASWKLLNLTDTHDFHSCWSVLVAP
jgi:hypothetical protein